MNWVINRAVASECRSPLPCECCSLAPVNTALSRGAGEYYAYPCWIEMQSKGVLFKSNIWICLQNYFLLKTLFFYLIPLQNIHPRWRCDDTWLGGARRKTRGTRVLCLVTSSSWQILSRGVIAEQRRRDTKVPWSLSTQSNLIQPQEVNLQFFIPFKKQNHI